MTRIARTTFLVAALVGLAACASPTISTEVTRFHEMPPIDAQTVALVAKDPAKSGTIEFAANADPVGRELERLGFQAAGETEPDFIAQIDYYQRPIGTEDSGGSRVGIGVGGGSGGRSSFGVGVGTSFNLGGKPKQIMARTFLIEIDDRETGARVFEGRAESAGPAENFGTALPHMIGALFDGFPGNSGETVLVKRKVE